MDQTQLQIDARRALVTLSTDRSKRAVFASNDALYYRYEGKQFSHLDFPTFVDLFSALTSQQLSLVAKIPDIIEPRSSPPSIFEDGWLRLYRDGQDRKPVWAALALVEAAQHALETALDREKQQLPEVSKACLEHVNWLKQVLCKPQLNSTNMLESKNPQQGENGGESHPKKRKLSETKTSHVDDQSGFVAAVLKNHPEFLSSSDIAGDTSQAQLAQGREFIQATIPCTREAVRSETSCDVVDTLSLLTGSIDSGLDPLFTSKTYDPEINTLPLEPFEADGDDWVGCESLAPTCDSSQANIIPSTTKGSCDGEQLPGSAQSDSEMNTRSMVTPCGTTSMMGFSTWTQDPCAIGTSSMVDASRTFESPSP